MQIFHDSIVSQFPEENHVEHKENKTKYRKMTRKPRSHVRILIYQTWAIGVDISLVFSSWLDRGELEVIKN